MQQVRATALLCAITSGLPVACRLGPAAIEATALQHGIMSCQRWPGQAMSGPA